jgi:hypothetical protein
MDGRANDRDLQNVAGREELDGRRSANADQPEAFLIRAEPRIPAAGQVPAAQHDLDVYTVGWQ